MVNIHERDEKMIQWMKLGGLAYDLNHDENLSKIFAGKDDEPKIQVLEEYGLTPDDCFDFRSDLEAVMLWGWWIGEHDIEELLT
jgi:hypothetical protein